MKPLRSLIAVFALFPCFLGSLQAGPSPGLAWIWFPEAGGNPVQGAPMGTRWFRLSFTIEGAPGAAKLEIACDNHYVAFLNGREVARGDRWEEVDAHELKRGLRKGRNVLAIEGGNDGAAAGLVAQLVAEVDGKRQTVAMTGAGWHATDRRQDGWEQLQFDDTAWPQALVLGPHGKTGPWGGQTWGSLDEGPPPYSVPEGFEVARVSSHSVIGSVVAFTSDEDGRWITSRENGPVLRLIDKDGDGVCEAAVVLTSKVQNCQGLAVFEGKLYLVGNGPEGTGLYRLGLPSGEGAEEAGDPELVLRCRGGMGEHGPHAVRIGPDGFLYVILGNHSFVETEVDPRSPHRGYAEDIIVSTFQDAGGHARGIKAPGGTVFRRPLDGGAWSLFCGGFRNAYDIDFNAEAELFTFDSDMEWDEKLPWYRPVRVNHCVPGAEFGWRTGSGKWPAYYVDSLPATRDIGRGSPTGVAFYQSDAFPERYQGAFFICDWSMGRIIAVFHRSAGGSYTGESETFVTGRPLNCTDVEVGPDGALYFSTGGRGTRGGLFKVVATGRAPSILRNPDTVDLVLDLKQPRSAWARGAAQRARKAMGTRLWDEGLLHVATSKESRSSRRLRAIDLLETLGPKLTAEQSLTLAEDADAQVRARAAWLLGDRPSDASAAALTKLLSDAVPLVARRAAEGLVRMDFESRPDAARGAAPALLSLLGHTDRNVRFSASLALERVPLEAWGKLALGAALSTALSSGLVALAHRGADSELAEAAMDVAVQNVTGSAGSIDETLDAIRALHLVALRLGELGGARKETVGTWALSRFPGDDWRLGRELAILLAYTQPAGAVERILDAIQAGASREQQIHYAYCLRLLDGPWTDASVDRFSKWFGQAFQWSGGHSFPGYIEYFWEAWLKKLPEETRKALGDARAALAKVQIPLDTQPQPGSKSFDELLDFLANDPRARSGRPEAGKKVFETLGCNRCHRVGDFGEGVGPDLTTVGQRFRADEILESIFHPSRVISDQYRGLLVVQKDGKVLVGMPAVRDNEKIVLIQPDTTRLTILEKDIDALGVPETSVMPEGLLGKASLEDLADLMAFFGAQ